MAKRGSRERNRKHWQGRVEAWKLSGQSQQTYCQAHGLALSTFRRWRRIFRDEARPSAVDEGTGGFLRVKLFDEPSLSRPLTLVLGNNVRIEIPAEFDPDTLKRVLAVVQETA